LEKLNRYETHLDRKFERTLAMLLKLKQLARRMKWTPSKPAQCQQWQGLRQESAKTILQTCQMISANLGEEKNHGRLR
jgi:hypothetical protein